MVAGFTIGVYKASAYDGGYLTLDRPCGTVGSTGGYGTISRSEGALGVSERNSSSGRFELVTLRTIAKIARAVVAGGRDGAASSFSVTPDTPYVDILEVESLDGGQAAISDAVVASYTDITLVAGYSNRVTSSATPFTSNDIGLILTIPQSEPQRMRPGHYKIIDVVGNVAYLNGSVLISVGDLEIPEGETTQVKSNQLGLVSGDTSYDLVVVSGTGFNTGTFGINSVSGGVATLDGAIGTDDAGYTGGEGYLSGPIVSSGSTRKPFEIANDGFSIPNSASIDLLWDETNDACRVRPLRSQQYDRCTCNLITDLATSDSYTYVRNVVAFQGKSPLMDPTDTDETLKVFNRKPGMATLPALATSVGTGS